MSELLPILRELLCEADAGRACAVCTVVQTEGSTPQCPGATMLLRSDSTALGTLGGGCVEAEVKRRAFELLQSGQSQLLDFRLDDDRSPDDGLICGGRMSVAVMPVAADANLEPYRTGVGHLERREPASFPVIVEQEGKRLEYCVNLDAPPTLLIVGAGHVGQAVARLMVDLDFHLVVIDDRPDFASPERFAPNVELIVGDVAETLRSYPIDAGCFIVIVTRGHRYDELALDTVIRSSARYVGMIGSKRKTAAIFRNLVDSGVPQELLDRVHSPIGLPIGAVTVPEIAVSIAAELVEARRQETLVLVKAPTEAPST